MKTVDHLPATTWIIIPGFNESSYIEKVLRKVRRYTENIIYVDDGSSDNTPELAKNLASVVLRHRVNLGKGAALKTGCEYAFNKLNAEAVILMDADDQHDAICLPQFQALLDQKHQVVFGVRPRNAHMPKLKRAGNAFASVLVWLLFGNYIPDIPCGYKAISKTAYSKLAWRATGYEVELEIASRVGRFRIPYAKLVVPLVYHDHDKGMTLLDVLGILVHIGGWRVSL